jgi:hypothetical protein
VALLARLEIRPSEADATERFVAVCTLTNIGDEGITLNVAPLASPSLALEIMDAAGAPVFLPPPPVPPADPPMDRLEPGRGAAAEFAGFLPGWIDAGTYRARFRYVAGPAEPIVSDWVGFTLTR